MGSWWHTLQPTVKKEKPIFQFSFFFRRRGGGGKGWGWGCIHTIITNVFGSLRKFVVSFSRTGHIFSNHLYRYIFLKHTSRKQQMLTCMKSKQFKSKRSLLSTSSHQAATLHFKVVLSWFESIGSCIANLEVRFESKLCQ